METIEGIRHEISKTRGEALAPSRETAAPVVPAEAPESSNTPHYLTSRLIMIHLGIQVEAQRKATIDRICIKIV